MDHHTQRLCHYVFEKITRLALCVCDKGSESERKKAGKERDNGEKGSYQVCTHYSNENVNQLFKKKGINENIS